MTIETDVAPSGLASKEHYQRFLSLVESRGPSSELGYVSLNLQILECNLGQFSDTATFSALSRLLLVYEPECVILSGTDDEIFKLGGNRLAKLVKNVLPSAIIITLSISSIKDGLSGEQYLRQHCLQNSVDSIFFGISKKFYCLAALANLFSHLEVEDTTKLLPNSIQFRVVNCKNCMTIDYYTAKNLELVASLSKTQSSPTLFSSLKKTRTTMGARFLRMEIMQPSTSIDLITGRHELIKELVGDCNFAEALRNYLLKVSDTSQEISRISKTNSKFSTSFIITCIKSIAGIYQSIKLFEKICESCPTTSNFQSLFNVLAIDKVSQVIEEVFDTSRLEVDERLDDYQLCYLVKSNTCRVLEVARRALNETIEDILEYARIVSGFVGVELQVKYVSHKFVLHTTKSFDLAGKSLIELAKNRYTTLELDKLNTRITEAMDEILLLSTKKCHELCQIIITHAEPLHYLNDTLGYLDFLLAAADYAIENEVGFPMFGEVMQFEGMKHPILPLEVVNNMNSKLTNFAADESFAIIRGPNASGKTTYIKQIALLQVIAQIGYPVPVKRATTKIFSRLSTRLGSDDDFAANASTFLTEMRDVGYILQEPDSQSLILIDELGRGSSVTCGLALTTAICDVLVRSRATVLFVTHFTRLVNYLKTYPSVYIIDLYGNGEGDKSRMAIAMAGNMGMPKQVINDAQEFLKRLEEKNEQSTRQTLLRKAEKRRHTIKAAYQVAKFVNNYDSNDENIFKSQLKVLRQQTIEKLSDYE